MGPVAVSVLLGLPLVNLLSSLFATSDPSNVSSLVHSAEMRVAETRAVNRALRKA
jgi:hypothetical protein